MIPLQNKVICFGNNTTVLKIGRILMKLEGSKEMILHSPATAISSGHGKPKSAVLLGPRLSFTLLFCAHGRWEHRFLSKQLVMTAQCSALSSKPCLSFLLCSWECTGKQQSTVRDMHMLILYTDTKNAVIDCPVGSWAGCEIVTY